VAAGDFTISPARSSGLSGHESAEEFSLRRRPDQAGVFT
jgi:hypothetical protein